MRRFLLLSSSLIWLFGSCEIDKDKWHFIRVRNNSSKTIRVCGAYILPDTMLPEKQLQTVKILSGKTGEIHGGSLDDKRLKCFKTEKVTLFILDEQVFQTEPWDTIRKYNMVLKRYEIDSQDLKNLSKDIGGAWALPYP